MSFESSHLHILLESKEYLFSTQIEIFKWVSSNSGKSVVLWEKILDWHLSAHHNLIPTFNQHQTDSQNLKVVTVDFSKPQSANLLNAK